MWVVNTDFRVTLHTYHTQAAAKIAGRVCGNDRGKRMEHGHGHSCSTALRKSLVGRNVRVSSWWVYCLSRDEEPFVIRAEISVVATIAD